MNRDFTFSINEIMEQAAGASVKYTFDAPASFEGIKSKQNITGALSVMKIPDAFNVVITDLKGTAILACGKCLKEFTQDFAVEHIEREFLLEPPDETDDPDDVFLADLKNQEISIAELLRQEIILHFPLVPVCSTGCKGMSNYVKDEDSPDTDNKPLAILKDLIK